LNQTAIEFIEQEQASDGGADKVKALTTDEINSLEELLRFF